MTANEQLFEAIKQGDTGEIRRLHGENAAIINEARDEFGYPPLHRAAEDGQLDVFKVLLELGADLEAKITRDKSSPWSIMTVAARGCNLEIIQLLFEHNVPITQNDIVIPRLSELHRDKATQKASDKLQELFDKPNQDFCKEQLFLAVRDGDPDYFKAFLLDDGFDINARENDGSTALHLAVSLGKLEHIQELLKERADFDAQDDYGETPLHIAVRTKNYQAAETLVRAGAKVTIQNIMRRSPPLLAIQYYRSEGESYKPLYKLLAKQLPVDKQLFIAVDLQDVDEVKKLIEKEGANVTAQDNRGNTPLTIARRLPASSEKEELIYLMLPRSEKIKLAAKAWANTGFKYLLQGVSLGLLAATFATGSGWLALATWASLRYSSFYAGDSDVNFTWTRFVFAPLMPIFAVIHSLDKCEDFLDVVLMSFIVLYKEIITNPLLPIKNALSFIDDNWFGILTKISAAALLITLAGSLIGPTALAGSLFGQTLMAVYGFITGALPFLGGFALPPLLFLTWWNLVAVNMGQSDDYDDVGGLLDGLLFIIAAPFAPLINLLVTLFDGDGLLRAADRFLETLFIYPLKGFKAVFSPFEKFFKLNTETWSGFIAQIAFRVMAVLFAAVLVTNLAGIAIPVIKGAEFLSVVLPYLQALSVGNLIALTWLSSLAAVNFNFKPEQRSLWIPLHDQRVNRNLFANHEYWIQTRADLNPLGQFLSFASLNVGAWGLTVLSLIEKPIFKALDYTGHEGQSSSQLLWLPYFAKLAVSSILFVAAVPLQVLSDLHNTAFDWANWATGSFMTAKGDSHDTRNVDVEVFNNITDRFEPGFRPSAYEPYMNAKVQEGGRWTGLVHNIIPSGLTP